MNVAIEKVARFCNRAMASFVVDDFTAVTPQEAGAFADFSRWVRESGLKGECSVILGMRRTAEGRALPLDAGFVAEWQRARTHIDSYMEVMTHNYLYDFAADRMKNGGPHEGVWLLDRTRPMEEYRQYFRQIAGRAAAAGVRHAGLTLPGCGCQACVEFYRGNHLSGEACEFNPAVYQALLSVAEEGLLAGPMCGLFVGRNALGPADANVMAERDGAAVYDLPPGVSGDFMGRWDRNPNYINVDAYISADGQGGRLPQLLAQETRTLIIYGHWQSLQPGGIGFPVLQEVAARLARHHGRQIIWMRPTEIMAYRHTERHTELRPSADGRSFTLAMPFAPLHVLTLRVLGEQDVKLRAPSGAMLSAHERTAAGAMFNVMPENGRYEILPQ
jgi:hypothetical protein